MSPGFSKTKNEKNPKIIRKEKTDYAICFAPLEPFEKNEQQLMQEMSQRASRQLHVDFDDDASRGEKSCQ